MWWLLLACNAGRPSNHPETVVAGALDGVKLGGVAIFGGAVSGKGTLSGTLADGTSWSEPVLLKGSTLGVVLEAHEDVNFGVTVPLTVPSGGVAGDDLFGGYHGDGADFTILLGADNRKLTNDAGVSLNHTWFSVGLSIFAGFDYLNVRPDSGTDTGT